MNYEEFDEIEKIDIKEHIKKILKGTPMTEDEIIRRFEDGVDEDEIIDTVCIDMDEVEKKVYDGENYFGLKKKYRYGRE